MEQIKQQIKASKKGLIFIHRDRFEYFDEIINRTLQQLYLPNAIKDLEVLQIEELNKQISAFIIANKLSPVFLLMIVSDDIIFEKNIVEPDPAKRQLEINNFVENIPFENPISRLYQFANGFKIVVMNKDMFQAIKSGFGLHGFVIVGLIPSFSLGTNFSGAQSLSLESAKYVLSKFDTLKQHSLISDFIVKQSEYALELQKNQENKKHISGIYVLLGVFIILMIGLAGFIFITYSSKPAKTPSPQPLPVNTP